MTTPNRDNQEIRCSGNCSYCENGFFCDHKGEPRVNVCNLGVLDFNLNPSTDSTKGSYDPRPMKINMCQRMSLSGLAVIFLALFDGCARLPLYPPDASNPIVKVAVLPIHNFTSDMNGPVWIRTGINDMVLSKHYNVIPNDQVDQILWEKMCVTLGGQLDYRNPATGAPSPSEVGQTLEVDGLIYCNLEDFQNIFTVVFNRRKLRSSADWLM